MNRKKFLLNTGIISIGISSPFGLKGTGSDKELNISKNIIREAHRGFSQLYPENTLKAFEEAINIGVDRIELDLRMSSDGKLVVIHDDTVDRTTNGKGKVENLKLKELQKLDAGSWKSPEFTNQKIPTLEEVFELANRKSFINIDLKVKEAALPLVKLAEKMNMADQLVITGKIPECTEIIRDVNKSITMFYEFADEIILNQPKLAVKKIRENQLPGCLINFKAANKTFIRESKLHGLSVSVWGVLEESEMKNLIKMGVDSIMTDNLLLLNNILSNK